ncbi:MAG: aldehyde dehydrogenase family protein [Chlorobiaceae bacterium]|nr:aldehyde dehydrogenase family protein [Chlorobiaceae bacterium]
MGVHYDDRLHAGMKHCFDSGRTRPSDWRLAQLRGLGSFLREREAPIARALQADFRKSSAETWLTETGWLLSEIRHVSKRLVGWMKPRRVSVPLHYLPGRAWFTREPLGVVLVIGAWNYPIQLSLAPLVGALAGGNCAVLKPSELAPETSRLLATELPRYVDPEAVRIVEGGPGMACELLRHRFDHIFFTGSRQKGREVMTAAARHLTPVTLELGGKCPCIVTESADLRSAARRIAWAKFLNAGQTCISPDYLLVHESVEGRLLVLIREALQRFYGEDPRASPDYARIADGRNFGRLTAYLDEGGVAAGGRIDGADRYIEPTLIRGVRPDSPLMREEIFGPVLPVLTVSSLAEAIDIVRAGGEPLAVYLFSGRAEDIRQVELRTLSGGICCNDLLFQASIHGLPFGGRGMSGIGAYHGRAGFDTFTAPRSILVKSGFPDPDLRYPPYGEWKLRLLKRIVNLFS